MLLWKGVHFSIQVKPTCDSSFASIRAGSLVFWNKVQNEANFLPQLGFLPAHVLSPCVHCTPSSLICSTGFSQMTVSNIKEAKKSKRDKTIDAQFSVSSTTYWKKLWCKSHRSPINAVEAFSWLPPHDCPHHGSIAVWFIFPHSIPKVKDMISRRAWSKRC